MERALASTGGAYGGSGGRPAAEDDDGITSRRQGGGGGSISAAQEQAEDAAASRVFSTSYFHPGRGHLAHYESYLMRAVDHKGFLDVQQQQEEDDDGGDEDEHGEGNGGGAEDGEWHTRYCVLKDGALSIYKEPPLTPRGGEAAEAGDAPLTVIPLEHVASVKSAESSSSSSSSSSGGTKAGAGAGAGERRNAFMIITPGRAWLFRAMAKADMQEWLFAFHRSLAVIVARLVDSNNNGHGHGGGGGGGNNGRPGFTPSTGLGGLAGGGGYHRYGMGAGGLLSSRNDTNLMASRRGLRFVEEQQLGHGHGRSLSGAPHRFRQASGTEPSSVGGVGVDMTGSHGGILRGISPPTRRGGAGVLRRGVVSSADTWGSPAGVVGVGGGSPAGAGSVGAQPMHFFSSPGGGVTAAMRPPMGSGQGTMLRDEGGVGVLGLRGSPQPPPAVPSVHAAGPVHQPQFYSTTTPADYLMLSSAALRPSSSSSLAQGAGGLQLQLQSEQGPGGAAIDVSADAEAQALAAMAASAARFSPSSTASFRRGDSASSLGVVVAANQTVEHTHQAQHATLFPTAPGLSLDLSQARRARVVPALQTPTPSTGGGSGVAAGEVPEYVVTASSSSPVGSVNGGAHPPGAQQRLGSMTQLSSVGGDDVMSPHHHDDGPGLMFEMSMDEVDAGVGGLRLSSPRPPSEAGGERVLGTTYISTMYPPLVEAAGGGLINVRVEEGSGGRGPAYHHPHHPSRLREGEAAAAAAAGGGGGGGGGGAGRMDEGGREEGQGRGPVSPGRRGGRRRPRPPASAAVGEGGEGEEGELGWTFGVISLQGIRKNQEDQYTAIPDLAAIMEPAQLAQAAAAAAAAALSSSSSMDDEAGVLEVALEAQAFYAIYDGHCGVRAARYARELMHHYLVQDPSFHASPGEAMTGACRRMDREVLEICERESLYCGTTAIMALIRGRKVTVGNLGDGAAVLCRGGQAVPLSTAQTPGRPDETARIERANGWVTEERELFVGRLHRMDLQDPSIAQAAEKRVQWVSIYRVCGELSVSRSIGDPDFKGFTAAAAANAQMADEGAGEAGAAGGDGVEADFPFAFPPGHSGTFLEDLVIADPEIVEAEIGPEDAFLLMACDGFWDVMDAQEAVDRAQDFLNSGLSAPDAAAQLGNLALRLGSSDNVTLLLIVFSQGGEMEEGGEEEDGEGMEGVEAEETAMR